MKTAIYNRGTARRPNYWVRYTADKELVREPTGAKSKAEAQAFARTVERDMRLGNWLHPSKRRGGRSTFAVYAREVIARRAARGVKTALKEETRQVRLHLEPLFGPMPLDGLTFKVIRDGFRQLEEKQLAGKTIACIHSTLRAILLEAADDELIVHIPPPLTARRGHLPPPVDKDPTWRETAIFDRGEIAALLACASVEPCYRVMYATYFLTGARFSELLPLRVRDLDRARAPLAALVMPCAKVRRDKGPMVRVVPVHPVLRTWLDWWLAEGYEAEHRVRPNPDDLLFPTASLRRQNRGEAMMSHGEVYKRWQRYHLPAAGLRHRRLHDARRTLITVARGSGADREVTRALTHRVTGDRVLDSYTSWEWQALCAAIARIEWTLPGPPKAAEVVPIGRARA